MLSERMVIKAQAEIEDDRAVGLSPTITTHFIGELNPQERESILAGEEATLSLIVAEAIYEQPRDALLLFEERRARVISEQSFLAAVRSGLSGPDLAGFDSVAAEYDAARSVLISGHRSGAFKAQPSLPYDEISSRLSAYEKKANDEMVVKLEAALDSRSRLTDAIRKGGQPETPAQTAQYKEIDRTIREFQDRVSLATGYSWAGLHIALAPDEAVLATVVSELGTVIFVLRRRPSIDRQSLWCCRVLSFHAPS